MKKAVIFNLGCKVNQYECDCISAGLNELGYSVATELGCADLYIINTCAVTKEAERKSRQILSRIRSINMNADIIITGCASEKNPIFYKEKGVKFVSGALNKNAVLNCISENSDIKVADSDKIMVTDNKFINMDNSPLPNRTRAYVKIQDGCNNFCSYCIIPYLRGRSVSRQIDDIVNEINYLKNITKEVVLVGINISAYGLDIHSNLTNLIKALKPFDIRIRLGSFYVEAINEDLLTALYELKQFCNHFHLSLQSGDDDVLKAMNRKYGVTEYFEKVNLIRKFDNLASITTDIIVGYPSETDKMFNNTLNFVEKCQFSDIHIFPFSGREGTVANLLNPLSKDVVESRRLKMLHLKERLRKEYMEKNVGQSKNVLIEMVSNDKASGYSENYIKTYVDNVKENDIINVKLTRLIFDGMIGNYIDKE